MVGQRFISSVLVIIILLTVQDHFCQGASCRVYPSQIVGSTYIGNQNENNPRLPPNDNCTRCENDGYFYCNPRTSLSDGDFATEPLESRDESKFYTWELTNTDVPVLFVFHRRFTLDTIRIHYSLGNADPLRYVRPTLSFYKVSDDFQVSDNVNRNQMGIVGKVQNYNPISAAAYGISTAPIVTTSNVTAKNLLMVISLPNKPYLFSVSEIEFHKSSQVCSTAISNNGLTSQCQTATTTTSADSHSTDTTSESHSTDTITPFTSPSNSTGTGEKTQGNSMAEVFAIGGVVGVLLICIITAIIIIIIMAIMKRRRSKKNFPSQPETAQNIELDLDPMNYESLTRPKASEAVKKQTLTNNRAYEPADPTAEYSTLETSDKYNPETGQTADPTYDDVEHISRQQEDVNPQIDDAAYSVIQDDPRQGDKTRKTAKKKKKLVQVPEDQDDKESDAGFNPDHVYSVVQKKNKKQVKVAKDQEQEEFDPDHVYSVVQKKKKTKKYDKTTPLDEMYSSVKESSDKPTHDPRVQGSLAVVQMKSEED